MKSIRRLSYFCLVAITSLTFVDGAPAYGAEPIQGKTYAPSPPQPGKSKPVQSSEYSDALKSSEVYQEPEVSIPTNYTGGSCGIADSCGLSDSCGLGCSSGCGLFGDDSLMILPKNEESCLFEGWKYSIGGELRYRYMDEHHRLRPAGSASRDTYQLWRFTPYLELKNEWVTAYVQAIDAAIFGEDLSKLPIDENRADLLQYYLDFKIAELDDGDLRFRYGRQFLKYGSQKLLSPLGWANTYRNFEGSKLYYAGKDWNIDAFAMNPVNGASGAPFHPTSFDTPDQSAWVDGVYATYKGMKNSSLDLYWVYTDENQPRANRHDGLRHTFGARYAGSHAIADCCKISHTYLWDLEGAYQFGKDNFVSGGAGQDVKAGFLSATGGITLNDAPWSPTFKGVFWWGSGDNDPNDGNINTVSTLYPLGHAYWGLIDNFNGSNLIDYSLQVSVKPMKKLTLLTALHGFSKVEANDYVYNIVGAPLGPLGTKKNIGSELDFVGTYAVNKNLKLQAGYFLFWYGKAANNPGISRRDADQIYFSASWNF